MKLSASLTPAYRSTLLHKQEGKCAICQHAIQANPVLDHDHSTGMVRGVLHRGCNAMLGHLENNRPRHLLKDDKQFYAFLQGTVSYLARHKAYPSGTLHHTHKTEDEKRLLRNKRARTARAKAKDES